MYDQSQLMRGTLEGCILQVISQQDTYGYEIATKLARYGFGDVKEGTVYPLLVRLEKKGCVQATFRPSPLGPSRKYYALTPAGHALLEEFKESWRQISATVDAVLHGEEVEESAEHIEQHAQ